ncbi:MAG: redoxin domain-containing protein [Acidimicrobiales bacterium]
MKVGERVSEFELLDQHGDTVTLSDLLDSGPAVFYFYVKAMTPG